MSRDPLVSALHTTDRSSGKQEGERRDIVIIRRLIWPCCEAEEQAGKQLLIIGNLTCIFYTTTQLKYKQLATIK